MTGRAHKRDALTTLLWPEYDQSSARADLRRTLSLLNRSLGEEWFTVDRETAGLSFDAQPWLDVNEFRRRLAATDDHDHPPTEACPDCLPLLEEAVEFYQDHFLAGFTLRDSLAFDEWQFFQTEGLRDQLAGALVRLAQYHTSQGDLGRAVVHARRWVTLDLTDEAAHRHLMVLYAQSGQRNAALRQYETCRDILAEELGVDPSQRTQETYHRILNGELPLGPSAGEAQDAHALGLELLTAQRDTATKELTQTLESRVVFETTLALLEAEVERAQLGLSGLRTWQNPYLDPPAEDAITRVRVALRQAELAVEELEWQLQGTQLRAPFDGAVSAVHLSPGE